MENKANLGKEISKSNSTCEIIGLERARYTWNKADGKAVLGSLYTSMSQRAMAGRLVGYTAGTQGAAGHDGCKRKKGGEQIRPREFGLFMGI